MARQNNAQLNIRSQFARARINDLVEQSGMTATEILEDALRGYVPPSGPPAIDGMIRKGRFLVIPAENGRVVTLEEAEAELEAIRTRDPFE